jgi:hypothetical protein
MVLLTLPTDRVQPEDLQAVLWLCGGGYSSAFVCASIYAVTRPNASSTPGIDDRHRSQVEGLLADSHAQGSRERGKGDVPLAAAFACGSCSVWPCACPCPCP